MHLKAPRMNLKFRQDNSGDREGGDEELGTEKGTLSGHGKQVLGLALCFREEVCICLTSRGSTLGIPTSEVTEFICLPHGQMWDAFHPLLDHSWTRIYS